jgi:hypothetical protein
VGGYTHTGLITFVLLDKEIDRFYLEESLYTVPIFPFLTDSKRKKEKIPPPC